MSNLIDKTEERRLNSLTELNRVALAKLEGEALDHALAGLRKRHGRSDAALIGDALANVHPDDLAEALAQANTDECICSGDLPICPKCGRRWEWARCWSDGSVTFFSDTVAQRYHALYGKPEIPFERVIHARKK